MKTQDILPVLVSILVIIAVAVLEKQSKLFAAITATMPIGATLGLWIVYAANQGERVAVGQFSRGMLLGILPSVAFLISVWLAARAGLKLVPMLLAGYATWGSGVVLLVAFRRLLGL